jgi:hypothetical protein
MAVTGPGAITNMKTTVLMSYEEGIETVKRSASVAYSPLGS